MITTKTQKRLLGLMREGRHLWWCGDAGPELDGARFWPQKRTVRPLLKAGLLKWRPLADEADRARSIREIILADDEPTGGAS